MLCHRIQFPDHATGPAEHPMYVRQGKIKVTVS
jgi:hypothetical protein